MVLEESNGLERIPFWYICAAFSGLPTGFFLNLTVGGHYKLVDNIF